MYELKFDANNCLSCQTYDCLTKCQYMDIDKDTAKTEMAKQKGRLTKPEKQVKTALYFL